MEASSSNFLTLGTTSLFVILFFFSIPFVSSANQVLIPAIDPVLWFIFVIEKLHPVHRLFCLCSILPPHIYLHQLKHSFAICSVMFSLLFGEKLTKILFLYLEETNLSIELWTIGDKNLLPKWNCSIDLRTFSCTYTCSSPISQFKPWTFQGLKWRMGTRSKSRDLRFVILTPSSSFDLPSFLQICVFSFICTYTGCAWKQLKLQDFSHPDNFCETV